MAEEEQETTEPQTTEPESPNSSPNGGTITEPQPDGEQTTEPVDDDRLKGLEAAKAAETAARQAAQEEAAYLRGQLEAQATQPRAQEVDWEAENSKWWENQAQYTHETASQIAQQAVAKAMMARDKDMLSASEQRVASKYDDYDSVTNSFKAMAKQDPNLWRRVLASPEPAQEAYEIAKAAAAYKDPKTLEAEIRARVEAEMKAAQAKAAINGVPTTQAGARGSGATADNGRAVDPLAGALPDY